MQKENGSIIVISDAEELTAPCNTTRDTKTTRETGRHQVLAVAAAAAADPAAVGLGQAQGVAARGALEGRVVPVHVDPAPAAAEAAAAVLGLEAGYALLQLRHQSLSSAYRSVSVGGGDDPEP
ncbi:hypothetical protein VPNG_10277 [Cytospora leucostoma]|uniref:Uncharacterized protein n=1 Tax=Cytospora leucostoma TaxID=1230097 RepID=A0A423VCY4_9PEZI|nr:hypothetical protein VPNG_10277 [Cytospora leucostoma]